MDCTIEFNSWLSPTQSEVEGVVKSCYLTHTIMYMTLESNTDDFSTNSTNHFRTQLPKPVSFTGAWEVALMDIQYPGVWNNVSEGRVKIECVHNGLRLPIIIRFPPGRYQNINELISVLKHAIDEKAIRLPTIFYKADLAMYKLQMLKVHDPDKLREREWMPTVTSPLEPKQIWIGLLRNPKLIPDPRPPSTKTSRPTIGKKEHVRQSRSIPSRQSSDNKRSPIINEGGTEDEVTPQIEKKVTTTTSTKESTKEVAPSQSKPPSQPTEQTPSLPSMQLIADRRTLQLYKQRAMQSRVIMKKKKPIDLLGQAVKINYTNSRIVIEWQPSTTIKRITFDNTLLSLLGFVSKRKIEEGRNIGDYSVNFINTSTFFIHCNLVQLQTVGNTLQQLLRTIPVTSSTFGTIVHKELTIPHYIEVLSRQFDSVEIWIADDTGQKIDFQFGKIILTLHFRRKTLLTR